MKKKLEALKKNQKGFTLVELIVVLVILAILAAFLVPALLGYIDQARNGKYLEEARSIYTALQAVNDERYAKGKERVNLSNDDDCKKINNLVTPTKVAAGDNASTTVIYKGTSGHDKYTVKEISALKFLSQDGKTVTISMKDDYTWDTDNVVVN